MKKIVCFFCLLIAAAVFSQEKTTLKIALNKLSDKHSVNFSYNDNEVTKIDSVAYYNFTLLKEELNSLSKQTQYNFEKIDVKNYILTNTIVHKKKICGTVINSKTNKPINNIKVFYKNKVVETNKQGYFELESVFLQDDFVLIEDLYFQKRKISVQEFKNNCFTISLEDDIQHLSEIVITDYLTRGFNKTTDGAVDLDTEKLGSLPGVIEPDVLQSIQLIPGVQSLGETVSGIHIRGSTPDQNLVLFDGMKMYHFSHFLDWFLLLIPT